MKSSSPASEPTRVFVYGSLLDPRLLDEVLGRAYRGERVRARLDGFQRRTARPYDYPFIVPVPGATVDGVVLMNLSPYDFQALDRYEEVETGAYRRQLVEVEAWSCGPRALRLQAHTYVAGAGLLAATAP